MEQILIILDPTQKYFIQNLLFFHYNEYWTKWHIIQNIYSYFKKKLFYFDTKLLIIVLPFYNYIFATSNYMLYTSQ